LLLDHALPHVLAQAGKPVFHAAAVARVGEAVAFAGPTGRGKTTLTTDLCRHGFALLTDDCLVLDPRGEQVFALPRYPGSRLWPRAATALFGERSQRSAVAHYTTKVRLDAGDNLPFWDTPAPLGRLYFLAPAEEGERLGAVRVTRLTAREAFVDLLPQ